MSVQGGGSGRCKLTLRQKGFELFMPFLPVGIGPVSYTHLAVIGCLDGIDSIIHGFVHPGVANRTDPDVCQSDKLLRSGEQVFVAIQQTHNLTFIHEALIHGILGNGIEQLALAADFLKQLNAIAMGTFPDFLTHDELAQINFTGEAGLFDLLFQVMEFAAVQTDNNGMISFPQRSTPLFFVFMGLF